MNNDKLSAGKPGVALVFLVVAVLLLSSVGVTYWAGLNALKSSRRLTALKTVISRLDQFLSTMKDAETGQRGYLLTGKEAYLQPYHAAVGEIGAEVAMLAGLASSGELSPEAVAQVHEVADQKLAELEKTVKDRREHGLEAALPTVLSGRGRRLMEDLRSVVGNMRSEKEAEYQQAVVAGESANALRTVVFAATVALNLAFLVWAYRQINKEIRRRENAIAETSRQKDLLATTLASIGDGVIVTDTEARVTFLNQVAASLTGWSAEDAQGVDISEVFRIVNEETRATVENPVNLVLRTGIVAGLANHTLLIRKDGSELNIDDSGAPIHRGDGQTRGVILVFRDITQRHRAEEALQASEERFRLLFQQAAVGIKRLDAEGKILEVNDRECEILGYSRDELLQLSLAEITHPEDRWREQVEEGRLLAKEIPYYSIEKRCLRKDGSVIWVRSTSSLPAGNGRQTSWWIAVIEEITQAKRAEETLRRTTEALARSNQDLEQFAYVASHDLQEPLRMVAGYLQLLSERYQGKLDEKADKYIAYAVDGAERMAGLIRDLLAYSRLNSGGAQLRTTSADEALGCALKNLGSAIRDSGAAIHCQPLPMVRADPTQLGQLFQNLVGNAVKFRSPDRPAEIHVAARQDAEYWHFTVQDNGIGFDERYRDKMFLVFQRLQGRAKYPGTGIGLAICKRIVERHGGTIWANSQPGQGATFHFTIPIKDA